MNSSQLLGITTFSLLFITFLYAVLVIFKIAKIRPIARVLTIIAFCLLTAGITLRWIESYQLEIGHAPLTNMYESVVFFAWTIIALALLAEWFFKTQIIGVLAVPFSFLAMAYASFSPNVNKGIAPLVPALQSNWLIAHVITCFIGYAAFALAAGFGLLFLIKSKKDKEKFIDNPNTFHLPSLSLIEDMVLKSMMFGFIWLSGGIITGAIWANSAWGTYWSWDPKETWSLITWFFYAITLHARYTQGWSGKKIAFLAIFGFISVLFTYYGVNYLLSGLHSYGGN